MDKYEYKIRADEIKALIAEGEFTEAVKIADTIDWRRVKSVMMLCTISDLYKINRRYQESKDILLLAYEKHPTGRLIVYSLCELAIKMEEYVQAIEYFKEFVQIAPRDTGRYILQYRLYEAQDVRLEDRIAVLEEFKKRDYREKWAYELAYLYHRIGLTTKCVEECDEMYLWFGDGKYVLKALELKTLHVPLNADQQARYDAWIAQRDAQIEEEKAEGFSETYEEEMEEPMEEDLEEEEFPPEEDILSVPTTELPEVKAVDVGQYNTLNLQMALAESMREILTEEDSVPEEAEAVPIEMEAEPAGMEAPQMGADAGMEAPFVGVQPEEAVPGFAEPAEPVRRQPQTAVQEMEMPEKRGISAGNVTLEPSVVEQIIAPLLQETMEMPTQEFAREYGRAQAYGNQWETAAYEAEESPAEPVQSRQEESPVQAMQPMQSTSKYDGVLSQEYDGQISLVLPDEKKIEKQITGQLSIEDIMAEWEQMKKSNEQKRMEDVRKRILEHTGSLFADFDEATKSGLLEQLEKAFVEAILKETERKPAIKKVILPEDAKKELAEPVQRPETVRSQTEDPITDEDEVEELEEIEEPDGTESGQEATAAAGTVKEEPETEEPEEETASEDEQPEEPVRGARELTDEERELFDQYVHHKKSRDQLVHALDNMSMAAYTGNVIVTGEEGSGTLSLAKGLIREMQYNDSNFSGKVAKITGTVLNKKDVAETLGRLNNGALIIEKASGLKTATVDKLVKALEKDNIGLLLILEDTRQEINQLLADNTVLNTVFNLRVDIEPLNDKALVAYAKRYAEENEYSIDEFGVLALHTRIADMQTSDHDVSIAEVRELVDEAIYYANKKTPKHFMDILLAKRYDDDDMIILRENDFTHN